MIISNGYIEVKKVIAGGGFDEDRNPIPPTIDWVDPIECQYRQVKLNFKAESNGEYYTHVGYEIYIDLQPFDSREIRLMNACNTVLGEYSVKAIEVLDLVGKIKITV